MNEERVIEILRDHLAIFCREAQCESYSYNPCPHCDRKIAFEEAIASIKKRIPKASIMRTDIILTSNPPKHLWICGNCGDDVGYDRQFKFCPMCGQKIDWS